MVVIGEIITEKPFEMAFVEDDDVIQALPATSASRAAAQPMTRSA